MHCGDGRLALPTADETLASQKEQAAAYAYAYYKTECLSGIDAMILFSQVDRPSYGLNMGLWTQNESVSGGIVPGEKKYIYNVFRDIDTEKSLDVTDFAKEIIGISEWTDAFDYFSEAAIPHRATSKTLSAFVISKIEDAEICDTFDQDTSDWYSLYNVDTLLCTDEDAFATNYSLKASFSAVAPSWRGIEKRFDTPYNASQTPYLQLALRLTGLDSDLATVKIKFYSGDNNAECEMVVPPESGWTQLCVDMRAWEGITSIDKIKVLTCANGITMWEGSLFLDEIGFSVSATPDSQNGEHSLASYETMLFNFEGHTSGWSAGENVLSVSAVQSIANAPFGPALGKYTLEAKSPDGPANVWRTIAFTGNEYMDFSSAQSISYAINGYGGNSGTEYETKIRLCSGEDVFEMTQEIYANQWNYVTAEISGWTQRSSVDKIEISYRAVGSSSQWYSPRFQLDAIKLIMLDQCEDETDMEIQSMIPFWNGSTMYNESVMMVSQNGEIPTANLLFEPEEILSVRSARLDKVYQENIDWVFENGVLKLTPNSSIPFMTAQDIYFDTYIPDLTMPKNGGGAVVYREGSFFHDRQIIVTYTHQAEQWDGPVPLSAKNVLPKTFKKLESGDALSMILFGDSISVGANASGYIGTAPHLPIWGQLVANELERYYGTHISFYNPSVGGKTSAWGVEQAETLVSEKKPDLVILAFGMNDGSGTGIGDGVRPNIFKQNILSIIQSVRSKNPNAEFILVGTTLPNAETFFFDQQPFYYDALTEIASEVSGVATANMTGVHEELLRHKKFLDMTGNNINHPNDFLSRWYAQFVAEMLKDSNVTPTTATDSRSLFRFEATTQGWNAGDNVVSVSSVSSIANGPFTVAQGAYALEAQFPTQEADVWRSISVVPAIPLNLSKATHFCYQINCYGGSGGTGYETKLRLYSGTNLYEYTTQMRADIWNLICADISNWYGKESITKIEISFRATGTSVPWYGSRFQIDDVHYLLKDKTIFDFEGSVNRWEVGKNANQISSVDHFANAPSHAISGAFALETAFPDSSADVWRTVQIQLDTPLVLSDAKSFYYYINGYGGSGGTGYETRIRLYSDDQNIEQVSQISSDQWNRISMDIQNWTYKHRITRIEISFRAVGTSNLWYGSRFQIDNVGYQRG